MGRFAVAGDKLRRPTVAVDKGGSGRFYIFFSHSVYASQIIRKMLWKCYGITGKIPFWYIACAI